MPQSIDEFLETQARSMRLRATLEAVNDPTQVKVTPWIADNCGCAASLVVPRSALASISPTGDHHPCCGKLLQIVDVEFGDEGRRLYSLFGELLALLSESRDSTECPQECGQEYQDCLAGCPEGDGGCVHGCKSRLRSCLRGCKFVLLGFTMQQQQQSLWCWAAVATSTSLFYNPGSAWTQCSVANAELGQTTCCADGSTGACNQVWFLHRALRRTSNYDRMQDGAVTVTTLRNELLARRPLAARVEWSGGGGHFVVLNGIDPEEMVTISDPLFGTSVMSLDAFTSDYLGTGTWTHSYFTRA